MTWPSLLFGFLFTAGCTWASPMMDLEIGRNTSLVRRNPTIITLDCSPDAGRNDIITDACANACYYINCRKNGDYVAILDRGSHEPKRDWSGCNIRSGSPGTSVCSKMPFSQQLYDYRHMDVPLECDEFPMALTKQPPWDDRSAESGLTNSLRCAIKTHNANAGRKVNQAVDDAGLENGDEFEFEFINADSIPYCSQRRRSSCDNLDWAQFEMTHLQTGHGKISNPYDYVADNHYRVSGQPQDIDGLFLVLDRVQSKATDNTDITYDLSVQDAGRTEIAHSRQTKKDSARDPPRPLKAEDGKLYADLYFTPWVGLDLDSSVFTRPMSFMLGTHFSWKSDDEGVDDNSPVFKIPTTDKHYCTEDLEQTADTMKKTMTCYFPTQRRDK